MNIFFPPAPLAYDSKTFDVILDRIRRSLGITASTQSASPYLLLQDADGAVWKITVDTSGNLQTESIPLGQSGSSTVPA